MAEAMLSVINQSNDFAPQTYSFEDARQPADLLASQQSYRLEESLVQSTHGQVNLNKTFDPSKCLVDDDDDWGRPVSQEEQEQAVASVQAGGDGNYYWNEGSAPAFEVNDYNLEITPMTSEDLLNRTWAKGARRDTGDNRALLPSAFLQPNGYTTPANSSDCSFPDPVTPGVSPLSHVPRVGEHFMAQEDRGIEARDAEQGVQMVRSSTHDSQEKCYLTGDQDCLRISGLKICRPLERQNSEGGSDSMEMVLAKVFSQPQQRKNGEETSERKPQSDVPLNLTQKRKVSDGQFQNEPVIIKRSRVDMSGVNSVNQKGHHVVVSGVGGGQERRGRETNRLKEHQDAYYDDRKRAHGRGRGRGFEQDSQRVDLVSDWVAKHNHVGYHPQYQESGESSSYSGSGPMLQEADEQYMGSTNSGLAPQAMALVDRTSAILRLRKKKLGSSETLSVLKGYGRQLKKDADFGEEGVILGLVGIETMIVQNYATVQELIGSQVFPDLVHILVRKCSDQTKTTCMRVVLTIFEKSDLAQKRYLTDDLGDFVVERLVHNGGELGALARELLVITSQFFTRS